jgi:signal transduction histidine kinase
MPTGPRPGLRRRLLIGLLAYLVLSSLAVLVYGYVVHEQAERTLWRALLEAEFDNILDAMRERPGYRWVDTETLALYGDEPTQPLPPTLAPVAPGLYDEVPVAGHESVALVRDVGGRRWALVLDITDMERRESTLALTMAAAMLVMGLLLGAAIGWGVDRLFRPLRELATDIGRLRPDHVDQRIGIDDAATSELAVIAGALNDFLRRNAQFVARERAFIDSASHELRTPVSVIAGAAELASAQPDLPSSARQQLTRIRRTTREIERLIALLLVLAKDPARLASSSDRIALDQLLPEIVADHRALAEDKGLSLALAPLPPCEIEAPMPVVQAAIGNLLRNAIENSDSGEIAIRLDRDATVEGAVVEITDPGHGMTPEQLSAIHARMARGEREGAGIGLDLIARLCEHLGWTLTFDSQPQRGTTARLDFIPRGGGGEAQLEETSLAPLRGERDSFA